MAIYNAEDYLKDAIESIINQSLSFEKNIELILVNDGSKDKSGEICKKYKSMYPNNIVYIDKENGGVSSARNAGLEMASGKIINFCDSDDYFSKDVFYKVKEFFEENVGKTDIVAIKLNCFESATGSWVNDIYFNETKIIDMKKEKYFMQCQVGASFIIREKALLFRYDTNIKIHEDSVYLYSIFRDKPYCGVISDAIYWHRIRKSKSSATQNINLKENVFSMSKNVILNLIYFYKKKYNRIPSFLQAFIIKEFDWYVTSKTCDVNLNDDEKCELMGLVKSIMNNLSERNIKNHPFITDDEKARYLILKRNIRLLYNEGVINNSVEYRDRKRMKKNIIKGLKRKIVSCKENIRYPFSRTIKKVLFLEEKYNIHNELINDQKKENEVKHIQLNNEIISLKLKLDEISHLKDKFETMVEKNVSLLSDRITLMTEENQKLKDSAFCSETRINELQNDVIKLDSEVKNLQDDVIKLDLEVKNLKDENGYDFKKNVEYISYFYGGSDNKGCEALLKTIIKNIGESREKHAVITFRKRDDLEARLDKQIKYIVEPTLTDRNKKIEYMGNVKFNFEDMGIKNILKDTKEGVVALSVGGDNYCYGEYVNSLLRQYNELMHECKIKTALLGCSIEPEVLKNEEVLRDLNMYDLIIARESLTYNALINAGINKNTVLLPDSAFRLNTVMLPLPNNFKENETIGINMSPIVIEANDKNKIVMNNYVRLIKYIIESTNYNVALIPHVFWKGSDDYEAMKVLYDEFSYTNRICIIDKHSSEEIKGYIARCKLFIGARTHAIIAAYSSCIPTLAVGYSIKAKGIALDLFGEYENYVIEAQKFNSEDNLLNAFLYIENNYDSIKSHLQNKIPEYTKSLDCYGKYIEELKEKDFVAPLPRKKCTGCTACVNICPVKCISIVKDEEGFNKILVDYKKCIKCGKCQQICPVNQTNNKIINSEAYAVKCDDKIRTKSSSGGVFYSIAKKIIEEKGVVYGAAFNNKFELHHIKIENINNLYRLQGSKYLESNLETIYTDIKMELEKERKVLFSGTPCQVKGLKSFLQKQYNNLYTIDVVCHGVPSGDVFRRYIEFLEKNNDSKIVEYSFRNKDNGWKKFNTKIVFENGKKIVEPFDKNIYMLGFLRNIYLRNSCYLCTSNNFTSGSDITLADFWGIDELKPEFDDDKGVSLVILNSENGKWLFSNIKKDMCIEKMNLEEAIKYNKAIVKPAFYNNNRSKFFSNIDNKEIDKNIEENLYD